MLKFRNHILLTLFSAGFIKTLCLPSALTDVLALLVMGAAYTYIEYKNQDKKMQEIEKTLHAHQNIIKDVQDKVSSIKVIQQAKPNSLTFRS